MRCSRKSAAGPPTKTAYLVGMWPVSNLSNKFVTGSAFARIRFLLCITPRETCRLRGDDGNRSSVSFHLRIWPCPDCLSVVPKLGIRSELCMSVKSPSIAVEVLSASHLAPSPLRMSTKYARGVILHTPYAVVLLRASCMTPCMLAKSAYSPGRDWKVH